MSGLNLGVHCLILPWSLVQVRIFCKAELEEERNIRKSLKSKKISGKKCYFAM